MSRRHVLAALAATASAIIVTATVLAQPALSIVTPTTTTPTTAPPLVIVSPTTSTTTTTTTTAPAIAAPTTATTASPVIAAPTTATTTPPVIATPTTTIPLGAEVPLGVIDTSGAVPDGLDLTAFPTAPGAPGPVAGDGPQLAAGFSCAYQCIKSGVAYPRGFGAQLVVETHVPAQLFISVLEQNNDPVDFTNSTGMVSEFSWALDHLEPGHTYFAMVAATDENGDTAYAYGEFTTMSQRIVDISVGTPTVHGGPTNIVSTWIYLKVSDLDFLRVQTGESQVYIGIHRHVDLAVQVFREWATSQSTFCEGPWPDGHDAQGDSNDECGTWNSASIDALDLDVIPDGRNSWTEVSFSRTFQTSAGDDALPAGQGDPRFFHFSAPVTLTVTYG